MVQSRRNGGGQSEDLLESDFAPDTGQVPTHFVVADQTAQVQNNALYPGELKIGCVCFHCSVRFSNSALHLVTPSYTVLN
jgi:hypothetical protein